ncbi:zinc-binding dehydrogenase [Streptomyces sp. TRM68367]|uniref:quinone oxidoreductase family protein n=1 Tax=Streptomyces sp. TRM68367 TaxID=2758415 RepID=UPI00165CC2AE|nr:zinc-binding dehydrogenase [Streptomyces sp. TRM68367]MBC9729680.1 zinc-binding dehydrogenase [Streptomyces sp. TRM68367]
MRAIRMEQFGGPEVLQAVEVPDLEPRGAHHLLQVSRAGVNFADMHVRGDDYLAPVTLPYIPGNEVVGRTAEGKRFVGLTQGGGYAEQAHVHRRTSWEVPAHVSDEQAVALCLQGNSAYHLLHTVADVQKGQTVVIPAAAGGLGSIAVQLAKGIGAKVIALASTKEKRQLAEDLGADAVVDSTSENLTEEIKEAAGGPVQVALEMTGGPTFHSIVAALAPRGRLAVYGYASGQTTDVSTKVLMERSIAVIGFWLPSLYSDRSALPTSMNALFDAVRGGSLRPVLGQVYPLSEAGAAHAALAARTHTGKLCLDTVG